MFYSFKIIFYIIFDSRSCLYSVGFEVSLYMYCSLSTRSICSAHLCGLDLCRLITSKELYKLRISSLSNFLRPLLLLV